MSRDMFVASFCNRLKGYKTYSIRDVLLDNYYIIPTATDVFCIKLPWRDMFERFDMFEEDGKYVLDFIYKEKK